MRNTKSGKRFKKDRRPSVYKQNAATTEKDIRLLQAEFARKEEYEAARAISAGGTAVRQGLLGQ